MGNTSSSKQGRKGAGHSKQGSAAFGPFSPDEFAQLHDLFKSLAHKGGKQIDSDKFRRHFSLPGAMWFASGMEEYFSKKDGRKGSLNLDAFREGVAATCRLTRANMIASLFIICGGSTSTSMGATELKRVFEAAHLLTKAAWPTARPSMRRFRSEKLAASVISFVHPPTKAKIPGGGGAGEDVPGRVSLAQFQRWVSERAPLLHHCLSTFVHTRCFLYGSAARTKGVTGLPSTAGDLPPSMAVFSPPQPQQPSVLLEEFQAELFGLALSNKALQGPWLRLYTSEEDGMSFNRVCFKLTGFGGPTVILVKEKGTGAVYGGCADSPWKESNSCYGGERSFLLSLAPEFKIIPSKIGGNRNFQYLNLKGFSLPHGIGMGGTTDAFRFFLPEALDSTCVGRSACLTFDEGLLCPHPSRNFEVDILEVWGVGGEQGLREALDEREEHRKIVAQQINKARQVDKSKFATNAFDKEFLLGKTFGGGGHYNANEDRRQGQS